MLKRISIVLLSLFFCFLSACAKAGSAPSAAPVQTPEPTPSEPNATPAETFAPSAFQPGFNGYFDGEIYVSLGGQDCDFYEDWYMGGLNFWIISKHAIGVSGIRADLPVGMHFDVDVRDFTEQYHTVYRMNADPEQASATANDGCFLDRHVMMLEGADWKTIGSAKKEILEYYDWFFRQYGAITEPTVMDPDTQAREQQIEAYEKMLDAWRDACDAFSDDRIPVFFVYRVELLPQGRFTDESADRLFLTLGDRKTEIPFGEWRFHSTTPKELKPDGYGLRSDSFSLMTFEGSAFDGGYAVFKDALSFTAGHDDVTVTGMRIFGSDISPDAVHVRRENAGGNTINDFYWDLQMPLDFQSGQTVHIDVILHDPCFAEYECFRTFYLILDYEVNGFAHSDPVPFYAHRRNDVIETYFIQFMGMDLTDYYRYGALYYGESSPDLPESFLPRGDA